MRVLLAVAALGLASPTGAAGCPQDRAVYSLGDATLTLEPRANTELGWGAILRAPTAPIRLHTTASNGIARVYLFSEGNPAWLSSEIEPLDEAGRPSSGSLASEPASPRLRLPGFGPKGVWRLTGCTP